MKQHPAVRLHLLLLAAFLLLQGVARAQDYLNDPNLPAPKHWEGTAEGSDDFLWEDLAYPKREEIDTKLARIRFLADVSRDFDGARKEMERLWLSVNFWNGFTDRYGIFEGKETLYVSNLNSVMVARIELQLQAGNAAMATHLVRYPYFHEMDPAAQGMATGGFQEKQSRAILDRAFDARWDQKRTELLAKVDAGSSTLVGQDLAAYITEHFGTSSPELTEQVKGWLKEGMIQEVQNLGLRATPALAMVVLQDLEGTRSLGPIDPLILLAAADEQGACRLASDFFHRGGQSFRLRVLHLLETQNTLSHHDSWKYPQVANRVEAPRCRVPYWVDVVAKLSSNERTLPRVMKWVQIVAERDALTPELQANLIQAVQEGDSREAVAILTILDNGGAIASCKPVLEAAMKHEDAGVRALAAEQLQRYPYSEALVRASGDSNPAVQLSVALSLRPREVTMPTYGYNGSLPAGMLSQSLEVKPTPESTLALAELILSTNNEIRSQAIYALSVNEWQFDSAAPYLIAAQTSEPGLAYNLMRASYPDSDTQLKVLMLLANSESTTVLESVDSMLNSSADWESHADIWAQVLLARIQHPQHGFLFGLDEHERARGVSRERVLETILTSRMTRTPKGIAEAIRVACVLQDHHLLSEVLSARREEVKAQGVALLSRDDLHAAFELATSAEDNYAATSNLLEAVSGGSWASPTSAYLKMVRNSSTGQSGRLILARALSEQGVEGVEDLVFEILQNEGPGEAVFNTVAWSLNGQTDDQKAQRALRALTDKELDPMLAMALAHAGLWTDARMEVAAALLAPEFHEALDWPPVYLNDGVPTQPTVPEIAFGILTEGPQWTDRHQEILVGSLTSTVDVVRRAGINVAMQLQDPNLIPIIGNAIRKATADEQQTELIKLLTSYMTREAGRELSQCAGAARHGGISHEINSSLQQIRSHLEQQAYWQGEQEERANESTAVKELVDMLNDSDPTIRTAAIDGLASFHAKEHLPKIIRMLKDPNAEVQRAAHNAIRVLQNGITSLEPGGDD